ncbi:DUF1329 domain-containing protein [Pseudomonas sp. BN414]|uniref:DUF1329 domain-containing protein n=1 Tax=unclassified Pseudomonas TaxID=196821 RepID=UPI002455AAA0|nr:MULTISPECIES: DUF1329 domain-containing protein [unclassified Pseudomonas]MDH4566258.1 DUF1329 domain-containing protein [Pseudomonas sp. BN414]MDH4581946.1 DUF1329 domain-containing protein [Pseudomonas sp. BN415]
MLKKTIIAGLVPALALCFVGSALAAVSAEEAKRLGADLTLHGAEKAGNADGSIPEYTGGLQPVPGYNRETMQTYINPYKDEKPLFSITSANMEQYSQFLTEGTKATLRKYPSYKLNVYPTHRSARYEDWVLKNIQVNATTAEMTGENIGDGIKGAGPDGLPLPGVLFPIPKNGYEVMWNHKLSFAPAIMHQHNQGFVVDSKGGVSVLSTPNQYHMRPWYDQSGKLRQESNGAILSFSALQTSPPQSAGVTFLNFYLPTADNGGQLVWFYTPGQRRARRAPDFAYDLPISSYGGVLMWDELFGFVGRMDRFDFKLVGKEERFVPYNAYTLTQDVNPRDALGKEHLAPEALRFEKHRVWIVEADRKPGARHVYSKRRFYIDEDSWQIVALETYDNAGKLWKNGFIESFPTYDVGGVNNNTWAFNDLVSGNYMLINAGASQPGYWNRSYTAMDGLRIALTPRAVEAQGVR